MILRARTILPISSPPIDDGVVWIEGCSVRAVGRISEVTAKGQGEWIDLGDAVLLPGVINAHCHLELTDMANCVPRGNTFTDWLKQIVAQKKNWGQRDYEQSARNGVEMLLQSGTTSVCDIVSWWPLAPQLQATKLRVWSCLEMIDFAGQRSWRDWITSAESWFQKVPNPRGGWGLSPHATYTATPDLYRASVELQRRMSELPLLLSTHVSESDDEREMFEQGGGALFEWLIRLGRDMYDCGGQSALELLGTYEVLTPQTLGVHLNALDDDEIEWVVRSGMSVVHCPASHRFFNHPPFPLEQLLARGVNVCVGTDSLASAQAGSTLDMFAELRQMRQAFPRVSAETILKLATMNGATALQAADRFGTIEPGKRADLIALRLPLGTTQSGVYETILSAKLPVSLVMIDGEIIMR